MKYFKKFRAFATTMRLFPVMLVVATAFIVINPQSVFAAAKCYDAFVGQAYECADTPGFPVDGKKGAKFEDGKCYIIGNPDKGWVKNDSCDPQYFSVIQKRTTRIPNAPANTNCPTRLQKEKGGCDIIDRYVNPAIKFLTYAIGLILTISIVWGGIQYASARDNPQAISAAKSRITNSIIVLIGYSLLWTFLQWLIPGGMLG